MSKHTITITATITDPEGKEIFKTTHTAEEAKGDGTSLFTSLVHPMELILSDAHRQFLPTSTE